MSSQTPCFTKIGFGRQKPLDHNGYSQMTVMRAYVFEQNLTVPQYDFSGPQEAAGY
ncbi:hypothetical protein SXCC_00266 [Gluconacetobacter sp. SXCC-1]|nr:hypothetical protein SXCC_00266 [Gluconacetobacter sp. SXCC-1]